MENQINNLYRNAGWFNKVFHIWAGKYVRWVNKNKVIKDHTDVVYINEADKTQVMLERFSTITENFKE